MQNASGRLFDALKILPSTDEPIEKSLNAYLAQRHPLSWVPICKCVPLLLFTESLIGKFNLGLPDSVSAPLDKLRPDSWISNVRKKCISQNRGDATHTWWAFSFNFSHHFEFSS